MTVIGNADPTRSGGATGAGAAVLAVLPMRGDRRVTDLAQPAIVGLNAEVSPDGHWVAYQSRERGQEQVYVRPFRAFSERRWQVSTNGGREPLWARSGRELFYLAPDGTMMGVPIEAGKGETSFAAGIPAAVIAAGAYYTQTVFHRGRTYDVSSDGARLLRIKIDDSGLEESADSRRFVIVENWFEELKQRVPSAK